jgi:Ras-related GTP-binding protein C/D
MDGAFAAAMSENKPRILLMGPRRSGKSSIQRVVFHKMSPHETLFLECTTRLDVKYIANNSFVQFQIWDFPGDFDFKGEMVPIDLACICSQLVLFLP